MTRLECLDWIGKAFAEDLSKVGVETLEALLEAGKTPAQRRELEKATRISGRLLLKWINRADLFRIEGVAGEYGQLLEEAGVNTVVELSKRNPENLHEVLKAVNREKKLVKRLPGLNQITHWIAQAKELPRIIEY